VSPTLIGFSIAVVATTGLVVTLGVVSLLFGATDFMFGKPKLKFLKSEKGENGFAFHFKWNGAKERAKFDGVRIKLFNPFGKPSQIEICKEYPGSDSSFVRDLDMGPGFKAVTLAKGFDDALVQVELYSGAHGITYSYEMKGAKFNRMLSESSQTIADFEEKKVTSTVGPKTKYGVIHRDTIADTVPGRGPKLKLATNPEFAAEFAAAGAATGEANAAAPVAENYSVTKVWIEPGCIVCNACEEIFPEVFEVTSDSCIIRPGAPMDDGLKVEEAAEACPVEVIKFKRA